MDVSSELIHSLLPVFLVTTLGASMVTVGLLEGVAEATAAITKVFSGALSDHFGRRKPLMVLGYALGAFTKPIFPLATSVAWVFTGRFVDRVGKGIRGAPRDALVADITEPALRGAAYGLRQALDSVGAFLGPLLAVACMFLFADDIRKVLWVGALPAFLAVALLALFVREPERGGADRPARAPLTLAAAGRLPRRFWLVVGLGAVFTLARFSEAFLVLRAPQVGIAAAWVPLVMVAMNLVYAATAYPFGTLSDRMDHRRLLAAGLVVLIAADLLLASAEGWPLLLAGVALWGVHMGMTQGLLAAMVADTAPADLRGTAYGFFNLMSGLAMLLASVVAGGLWQRFGAPTTFGAGALFCGLAMLGLLARRRLAEAR